MACALAPHYVTTDNLTPDITAKLCNYSNGTVFVPLQPNAEQDRAKRGQVRAEALVNLEYILL